MTFFKLTPIFCLAGSIDERIRETYHEYLEALGVKPGERPSREVGDHDILEGEESDVTSVEGWNKRKSQVCSLVKGRVRIATVTTYLEPWDAWRSSRTVIERAEAESAGLL